jgi:hypothetical protein
MRWRRASDSLNYPSVELAGVVIWNGRQLPKGRQLPHPVPPKARNKGGAPFAS